MAKPSIILAMDTATGPCSVAVWKDGKIASFLEDSGPSTQSARLMPLADQALKEAGVSYQDLTAVACTTGPGSFTGIRVALAAARGIALAAGIPGIGFTTLEALAFAARVQGKPILAVLNAGKGEWYFQGFAKDGLAPLFEPRLDKPEAALASLKDAAVTGNVEGAALPAVPRADALAELAARAAGGERPLVPFYIREPDAIPTAMRP